MLRDDDATDRPASFECLLEPHDPTLPTVLGIVSVPVKLDQVKWP
jgi:hypothetical protein